MDVSPSVAAILRRHLVHGPRPLVPRYHCHERVWTQRMPYLFQRQIGGVRRVTGTGTVLNNLRRQCQLLGETNPAFRELSFTPHDLRRLFATELMTNGLPSTSAPRYSAASTCRRPAATSRSSRKTSSATTRTSSPAATRLGPRAIPSDHGREVERVRRALRSLH